MKFGHRCLGGLFEDMSSKNIHGREAKSLKNGIPTLCKGLQFSSSASPCRPPKQTNKKV